MAAREIATAAHQRVAQLEQEALDLKKRLTEKETEGDLARSAADRALNPPIKVGIDYACPRCTIINGTRSAMRSVSSKTKDDIFECRTCGYELTVPPFC